MKWSAKDIPDQSGRVAIVTGANTGIGFETARALAKRGARVTLACRSQEKGEDAVSRIAAELPTPGGGDGQANEGRPADEAGSERVEFAPLDLSDLDSVSEFAAEFSQQNQRLDLLINNAGVMMCPESKTVQGSELQLGVNHLGHFALTARLLPLLLATPGSRVVTVSSLAHRRGRIDFDDLHFASREYAPMTAYSQSKLANLLFAFELQRRLEEGGTISVAAHPGWTSTDLQRHSRLFRMLNPLFSMRPEQGALPTLRAATDPEVGGGEYYGPDGFQEMRGHPRRVDTEDNARDLEDARLLWELSEQITGVSAPGLD